MLGLAIGAAIASAAFGYLIGYVFVAPRDSFLRTKLGLTIVILGGLSFVPLPPQLIMTGDALGPMASQLGSLSDSLSWPASVSKGLYLGVWLVTTLGALLVGIRIWKAGKPGWRPSGGVALAYDSSAAGRASALLPMADTLPDALDVLKRTGVNERDATRLTRELREVGRRFATDLPPESGGVYQLVSTFIAPSTASTVTGLLLEGADRGGQIASVRRR